MEAKVSKLPMLPDQMDSRSLVIADLGTKPISIIFPTFARYARCFTRANTIFFEYREGGKKRFHHSKNAYNGNNVPHPSAYPYGFIPPPFFPMPMHGQSLQPSSTGGSETSTPPTGFMPQQSPFFPMAAIPMPDGSFIPVMIDAAGNPLTMPAGFMPQQNFPNAANPSLEGQGEFESANGGDQEQVNGDIQEQGW